MSGEDTFFSVSDTGEFYLKIMVTSADDIAVRYRRFMVTEGIK